MLCDFNKLKYFTLKEFTNSETARKYYIHNSVPDELLDNAFYTLSRLDDIREKYGKPIYITSGYRCEKLNKKVGGKPNSQHLKAEAVDLKWDVDLLSFLIQHCHFDQLIRENNGPTRWIHISFKKENERNQVLNISL